jgi:hypothetical protein
MKDSIVKCLKLNTTNKLVIPHYPGTKRIIWDKDGISTVKEIDGIVLKHPLYLMKDDVIEITWH